MSTAYIQIYTNPCFVSHASSLLVSNWPVEWNSVEYIVQIKWMCYYLHNPYMFAMAHYSNEYAIKTKIWVDLS